MGSLSQFVEFHEEGPREGFQIEKRFFPLDDRARVIDALSETGLRQIQVASFVSPKAAPLQRQETAMQPGTSAPRIWSSCVKNLASKPALTWKS